MLLLVGSSRWIRMPSSISYSASSPKPAQTEQEYHIQRSFNSDHPSSGSQVNKSQTTFPCSPGKTGPMCWLRPCSCRTGYSRGRMLNFKISSILTRHSCLPTNSNSEKCTGFRPKTTWYRHSIPLMRWPRSQSLPTMSKRNHPCTRPKMQLNLMSRRISWHRNSIPRGCQQKR